MLKYIVVFLIWASFAHACDRQEILAKAIYYEARDQPHVGMLMVAEVVLNRRDHDLFPNTICKVVSQPNQFSWYGKVGYPKNRELWYEIYDLAGKILNGEIELPNSGATHFINPTLIGYVPKWAKRLERVGRIGDHVFYRI